jgi:hypothetical protein
MMTCSISALLSLNFPHFPKHFFTTDCTDYTDETSCETKFFKPGISSSFPLLPSVSISDSNRSCSLACKLIFHRSYAQAF